jgi:hypothetical protein
MVARKIELVRAILDVLANTSLDVDLLDDDVARAFFRDRSTARAILVDIPRAMRRIWGVRLDRRCRSVRSGCGAIACGRGNLDAVGRVRWGLVVSISMGRWGVGINRRFGAVGINRRFGTIGVDRRLGSVGIDRRWGVGSRRVRLGLGSVAIRRFARLSVVARLGIGDGVGNLGRWASGGIWHVELVWMR